MDEESHRKRGCPIGAASFSYYGDRATTNTENVGMTVFANRDFTSAILDERCGIQKGSFQSLA